MYLHAGVPHLQHSLAQPYLLQLVIATQGLWKLCQHKCQYWTRLIHSMIIPIILFTPSISCLIFLLLSTMSSSRLLGMTSWCTEMLPTSITIVHALFHQIPTLIVCTECVEFVGHPKISGCEKRTTSSLLPTVSGML